MDTDIRREVVSVMCEVGFQEDELLDGARLAEDLDIDSTEMVEIVVALEEHFGISIDADGEGAFKTLGDMVACVTRLRSSGVPVGVAATEG
ncbi:acyl carrier protein [Streptomyces sp. ISL-10]|jgi:acyl carrier protein|uniref:acyl carrier protein n=1 Tax=Streptomyces sp. ISL-10 TaxID=2819172 RepID=UPI001BE8B45E|nr:phosphopantetheine-binding protein [Streptomyces sp. ISL-10]MBT2365869.1 acyl carrier protein [Streptomyces sp. ISL-10]